jgi:nicotinate-nucleotide adenylyltransferase
MLKLATEGEEKYEVLDIELKRGGISYTIDTLRELKKMNPDDVLYLIIGGDQLTDFKKWKNANEIADLITLIVYERDGHHFSFAITTPNANIVRLKAPRIDVSSTDIRKRIGKGQSIADYVPLKVEKYIKKEQLYRK